jgi:FtsH-binding integral membrane protein
MDKAIILLGLLIAFMGGLFFLVAAFRVSIWWGLACLFIPIVQLFFLLAHWPQAKKPFGIQLLGLAVLFVGYLLNPQAFHR